MPQLQTLVLTDRAATPVDHTFTPRDIANGVGTVVEQSGVPIGESRLQISLTKTGSGRYKAVMKLAVPTTYTDPSGAYPTQVLRTAYADLTFTFDATSTEQERKNIAGMLASALDSSKTLVNDTVVKLQGVY
jgi:hypothetical protein